MCCRGSRRKCWRLEYSFLPSKTVVLTFINDPSGSGWPEPEPDFDLNLKFQFTSPACYLNLQLPVWHKPDLNPKISGISASVRVFRKSWPFFGVKFSRYPNHTCYIWKFGIQFRLTIHFEVKNRLRLERELKRSIRHKQVNLNLLRTLKFIFMINFYQKSIQLTQPDRKF